MANLTVASFFTQNTGVPATGLALADIDLYLTSQNRSTGADTVVWNGAQNPTEEIDNIGAYIRIYTDADFDTYNYFARASYTGVTTLDTDHVQGAFALVNPWELSPRTLTMTAAAISAVISGTSITIHRGDYISIPIASLGDISLRTELWFTVKRNRSDADTQSIIQITEGGGLVRLNGAAYATPAHGSITVTDAVAGDITIAIDEAATLLLVPQACVYDVQVLSGGNTSTLADSQCDINADITRSTS